MSTPITIIPKDGIVNIPASLQSPLGAFRMLTNARLSLSGGRIEQTPYFVQGDTHSAGTYYNAGNQTEPATNVASLLIGTGTASYLWISRYGAWNTIAQVQVIKQTTVPAGETLITGCLLVVNSYTGLAITLGNTLDIVIEAGGATFKWRKNGGAYTTALACSVTGTSIDGGNATVYFLAASGLNPTDTWTWTRSDWFTEASGLTNLYDWSYAVYGDVVYFCDYYNRVMVYQNGGVRSAGYRPVYGTHVAMFENHLFVANYANAAITAYSIVIANSDLDNFDSFFATDVNEADTFTVPAGVLPGDARESSRIIGLWVSWELIHVVTTSAIYRSPYYGLPVPFSFKFFLSFAGSPNMVQPVASQDGVFLVATHGIFFFDGAVLRAVSQKLEGLLEIYNGLSGGLYFLYTNLYYGGFDTAREEAYFYLRNSGVASLSPLGAVYLVYHASSGSWYVRSGDFAVVPYTMMSYLGNINLPYSRGVMPEDVTFTQGANTMAKDYNTGVSFQMPVIETEDLTFGEVQVKHEINDGHLDAYYGSATGAYSATGVTVAIATRDLAGATVTYTTADTFTIANPQINIRDSAHVFRFRLSVTAASTKVPNSFVFNALVLSVINITKDPVRR